MAHPEETLAVILYMCHMLAAAAAHGHSNRVTGGYQSDLTSVMFSASRSLLAADEAPQPTINLIDQHYSFSLDTYQDQVYLHMKMTIVNLVNAATCN